MIVAVVLVASALSALAAGYYLAGETSSQNAYWTIDISPVSGPDLVTPNGTIQVPINQSGITVTAVATGINGFTGWNLDGQPVANANSTIFIARQQAYSNHTLEARFVFGTPPLVYSSSLTGIDVPESEGILNASQGSIIQANFTLTSMTSKPITVPIQGIRMTYYNATIDLHRWVNTDENYSQLQAQAFTFSFGLNQLTLQPDTSNSTLITIKVADDAPLGQYLFFLEFGSLSGLDFSYGSTINFGIIVTPTSPPQVLYKGEVSLELTTKEPSYTSGSTVQFLAYLINGKDEPIPYPNSITYTLEGENASIPTAIINIDYVSPHPSFPAHSKAFIQGLSSDATFTWNQKDINLNLVPPGNYTMTMSFGNVSANCTFKIVPNAKQEASADVLKIGIKYIESKYGTDYTINGVTTCTYSSQGLNENITLILPAASFRVPADWQKPGQIVWVMVDLQTGEVAKAYSTTSKPMPPG